MTFSPRVFSFLLLLPFVISCASQADKNSETDNASTASGTSSDLTLMTVVQTFPIDSLKDLIDVIPASEFKTLLANKESASWILQQENENALLMKHKEYDDNSVRLLFIPAQRGLHMLMVQQVNAQVVNTQGWRYKADSKDWMELGFPVIAGSQFVAENVSMPDGYDDMTFYSDISLDSGKITSRVNTWRFGRELEESYPAMDASLLDSFFKYYFEIEWNGEEFTIGKKQLKDYTPVFNVTAEEQTEDTDGPGITEFDCASGYTVTASSELPGSGNVTYSVDHILKDDAKAWSEGADGDGLNESIEFTITDNFLIGNSYQLRNGFVNSASLWKANNRVKSFEVMVNDKTIATVTLKDIIGYQYFAIIPPFIKDLDVKKGDRIKFIIKDVYKGDKYNDTVISYFVPQGNCG
jgi:hypothetical protein